MARPFFVLVSLCLILSACTQRLICPAYQSAFIYDKNELRKKFSYFLEDSTPKILTASKTKYLIAEPVSYRKKVRSLQTVEMKDVNPVLPDSMKVGEEGLMGEDGVVPGAELDLAARSVIDSTYIVDVPQDTTEALGDSLYVISKDKEIRMLKYDGTDSLVYDPSSGRYATKTPKYVVNDIRFNVEQDNYMWYLRKNLVLPDVRLSQNAQAAEKSAKPKKEKKGFFRNLFKRKKNEAADSTLNAPAKPSEEFDYVDENEGEQQAQVSAEPQEKKKKGIFSFLKKDKAAATTEEAAPADAKPKKSKKEKKKKEEVVPDKPKEEKEEDDGF